MKEAGSNPKLSVHEPPVGLGMWNIPREFAAVNLTGLPDCETLRQVIAGYQGQGMLQT